eukprot:CAMPEP_0119014242 /NCGR_PEP_ID=MMETSP1176-20130426/9433_1 /TAXON_ID=265551 /ORGANISM="Synedropsis recta cf, Strain CCMP1620" /LENGTH=276 /DNA_ID=CAMNT_0006967397 /DNA_START=61 /DNA_END=891 /DNA_ORIENTATION=+
MTLSPQHELLFAPSAPVIDFDLSKMGSAAPQQKILEEPSLEGDYTQYSTETESDDSFQAGVHFVHLKKIDGSNKKVDVLRSPGRSSSFSILKQTGIVSDQYILAKKRVWKNLPAPDLNTIRQEQSEKALWKTSASVTTATAESIPRGVTFQEVNLRFYEQTLGDHPSTSYGPPISLDWKYQETESISIDEYEQQRGKRRSTKEMVVNYYTRKNTLMWYYGHTEEEIKKVEKASKKIKLQRGVTNYLLPLSKVEDFVKSAGRKAKRAVKMGRRSTAI